jgi:hypothetical protein
VTSGRLVAGEKPLSKAQHGQVRTLAVSTHTPMRKTTHVRTRSHKGAIPNNTELCVVLGSRLDAVKLYHTGRNENGVW